MELIEEKGKITQIGENNWKLNDNTYLKKDGENWYIYYPVKKDITKPFTFDNTHWFNLLTGGSIKRIVYLGIVLLLLLFVMWSYQHDINSCYSLLEEQPSYIINQLEMNNEHIQGQGDIPIPPQDIVVEIPE